ncbi:MAG: flagellar hook capping FlgD N-terminal domain-containing protein [Geminicoccaceae bacterium]
MTISAVGVTSGPGVKSSSQSLAANFDNFLHLLTTQLQNQDPLAPMDANSFTSQLVQFASVEQAIQSNTKLSELAAAVQSGATTSAMSMLSQEVTAATDRIALVADGDGLIHYQLAEPAGNVRISVLDANGRVVQTMTGGVDAGEHLLRWDGTDAAGRRSAAGQYTVRVEAMRADGTAVGVEQFITGKVQGIERKEGQLTLLVDGLAVPMSAILTVRQAD